MRLRRPRHILILVQNLSVPLDRRVWNECGTLVGAGHEVSVICPRGKKHDRRFYERCAGVSIYRYPAPRLIPGLAGYIWEYGYSLSATLLLALIVYLRRPFDVIHACNPPDLFFLIGRLFRRAGVSYVFDHHDANPEILIEKREGVRQRGIPELVVSWAERRNFAEALVVISPNGSYRDIALRRGGKAPQDVVVVRSGPRLREFSLEEVEPFDLRGHEYLIGYLGVMGRQDGVELLVEATALLIARGYDLLLYLAGDGESYGEVAELVRRLGLEERVLMPGYQSWREFYPALRAAHVCAAPDYPGPFNDISTMNKIIEYMALERPCVAFGLPENRVTGGDTVIYAERASADGLASALASVLDMGPEREALARRARERFERVLAWEHSEPELLRAYARLEELAAVREAAADGVPSTEAGDGRVA